MNSRNYTELRELETFEERYEYLRLGGEVGHATFGFDRWLNQRFYVTRDWDRVRSAVIVRDMGCDLGVLGYDIASELLVHHMNPVTREAILNREPWILDPEFLVTTCHRTHNAIHYGDRSLLPKPFVPRFPGDTRLW
jgi:hypothetical protein